MSSRKTTDIEATSWSPDDTFEDEAEAAAEGPSPPLEARINFRNTKTIDRLMPKILMDRNMMTPEAWQDFCDSADEDIQPFLRAQDRGLYCYGSLCGGCIPLSILVVLAIGGVFGSLWKYVVFAVAFPLFFVSAGLSDFKRNQARDKAINGIADRCAHISNQYRDLTLKLYTGDQKILPVENWYIEVNVDSNYNHHYNNNAPTAAAAPASVIATPVVVAAKANATAVATISVVGGGGEAENAQTSCLPHENEIRRELFETK